MKAGWSKSKSKSRQISKNTRSVGQSFAVGHQPPGNLTPQDESLFRAFQSNLLSLVSHELRTPLMGILNALNLLAEEDGGIPLEELARMARQNAHRLQHALDALLDLAGIESGAFQVRLKEIELGRLVSNRMNHNSRFLQDRGIEAQLEAEKEVPILGDPQKLGRAVDLGFQILGARVKSPASIKIRISLMQLTFETQIDESICGKETWDAAWSRSIAGFQGGVTGPGSAFAGVLQSEEAFLTRSEEGFGSEFLLIHEILRLHHGRFEASRLGSKVSLQMIFPALSSEESLRAVLASRAADVSNGLSSVALVLIHAEGNPSAEELCQRIKKNLFRASDAVYSLPERRQCALVLDDCKPEDAPGLVQRLAKSTGLSFRAGISHCPGDGLDPMKLLEIAQKKLADSLAFSGWPKTGF